jgi:hypothetical protein
MGSHEARDYWEDTGLMLLMAGFLLAPLAWTIDLQASYALVKLACARGSRALLLVGPAFSLSLIALGTSCSWSCWRKLRGDADQHGARQIDRSLLLALSGLAMNAIFALLIVLSLVPRLVLSPCE